MPKLTKTDCEKKKAFHEKKVKYYQKKIEEIESQQNRIGFKYNGFKH